MQEYWHSRIRQLPEKDKGIQANTPTFSLHRGTILRCALKGFQRIGPELPTVASCSLTQPYGVLFFSFPASLTIFPDVISQINNLHPSPYLGLDLGGGKSQWKRNPRLYFRSCMCTHRPPVRMTSEMLRISTLWKIPRSLLQAFHRPGETGRFLGRE